MKAGTTHAAFSDRFNRTWRKIRRAEMWHGVLWTVFVALAGLAVLAAGDYLFELPWLVRALGLGAAVCTTLIAAGGTILLPIRWWSRPRTAVEIEQRFPELGQRIRTVVQFAGRDETAVAAEGAAPGLVAALDEETDAKTRPLDLNVVVPWRRLVVAAILAGIAVVVLPGCALLNWEWRLATQRALLGDRPYTGLTVRPGDALIDQGEDLTVSLELKGRVNRRVVVCSRPIDGDESWTEKELPAGNAQSDGGHTALYETILEEVEKPTEYRVVAGPAQSDTYRIGVRYPLKIEKFDAVLTPPAYTGLQRSTVEGGDLDVIQGTGVELRIELDRPCTEAFLVLADDPYRSDAEKPEAKPTQVPMAIDGTSLVARLPLTQDTFYSIVARAPKGPPLAENRYHVRVREDQPPHVRFEEPYEALEVHPIAEVLMRMRATDDFGLSKMGIVFQVNNDQEQTLLVEDLIQAAGPDGAPDKRPLLTRAACEKMLLLENCALTPTDSVTYYAFAEDNFPGQPKRTESELRFIDIRSFKRIYRVGGT